MKIELSRMDILAQAEAQAKREKENNEAKHKILINIISEEDVLHPIKAFATSWDIFHNQFDEMIKKNEEMEKDMLRYSKKVEELEAKIKIAEAKQSGEKITSTKKAAIDDIGGEDY